MEQSHLHLCVNPEAGHGAAAQVVERDIIPKLDKAKLKYSIQHSPDFLDEGVDSIDVVVILVQTFTGSFRSYLEVDRLEWDLFSSWSASPTR